MEARRMSIIRRAVAGMCLSAAGLSMIANWEGFSPTAYIPVPGDVPTIGFGSTSGVKMGDTITVPEALNRLMRDAEKHESAIHKCVKVPLSQGEYDAFVSLAYNIGEAQFCASTAVKRVNQGDYEGACEALKMFRGHWLRRPDGTKIRFEVVPGLVNRREAEYLTCTQGHEK